MEYPTPPLTPYPLNILDQIKAAQDANLEAHQSADLAQTRTIHEALHRAFYFVLGTVYLPSRRN